MQKYANAPLCSYNIKLGLYPRNRASSLRREVFLLLSTPLGLPGGPLKSLLGGRSAIYPFVSKTLPQAFHLQRDQGLYTS